MKIDFKILVVSVFSLLLALSSCKVKYLEYELKLEKARNKNALMLIENKELAGGISLLKDSLNIIVDHYQELVPYSKQIAEIEIHKRNFIEKRIPHYLALKKKHEGKPKKKKK